MKILFMGTPDFALFSLKAMVEAGEELIGVVTQPDQPKGRGYTLTPPPVKIYAQEHGIPVYQPTTLRDGAFYELLQALDPELIVVTAYGKILPASVLEYPVYGCVNVHGSLLPEYRGAAPIQRAIIDGKEKTGVTTMRMDVGLDTGDILFKGEFPILPEDTFETVHDKMGEVGANVLIETITAIRNGTAKRIRQDDSMATYATKIEKSDCRIDFSESAKNVHNRIRGLSPVPLAFTHTPDGKLLKIVSARMVCPNGVQAPAGTVTSVSGGEITVACGEGSIALLTVLPEGKGRMSANDMINGRRIRVGDVLS